MKPKRHNDKIITTLQVNAQSLLTKYKIKFKLTSPKIGARHSLGPANELMLILNKSIGILAEMRVCV